MMNLFKLQCNKFVEFTDDDDEPKEQEDLRLKIFDLEGNEKKEQEKILRNMISVQQKEKNKLLFFNCEQFNSIRKDLILCKTDKQLYNLLTQNLSICEQLINDDKYVYKFVMDFDSYLLTEASEKLDAILDQLKDINELFGNYSIVYRIKKNKQGQQIKSFHVIFYDIFLTIKQQLQFCEKFMKKYQQFKGDIDLNIYKAAVFRCVNQMKEGAKGSQFRTFDINRDEDDDEEEDLLRESNVYQYIVQCNRGEKQTEDIMIEYEEEKVKNNIVIDNKVQIFDLVSFNKFSTSYVKTIISMKNLLFSETNTFSVRLDCLFVLVNECVKKYNIQCCLQILTNILDQKIFPDKTLGEKGLDVFDKVNELYNNYNQDSKHLTLAGLKTKYKTAKIIVEDDDENNVLETQTQNSQLTDISNQKLLSLKVIKQVCEFLSKKIKFIKIKDENNQIYFCDKTFQLQLLSFTNNMKLYNVMETKISQEELETYEKQLNCIQQESNFKTFIKGMNEINMESFDKDQIQKNNKFYFNNCTYDFITQTEEAYSETNMFFNYSDIKYDAEYKETEKVEQYLKQVYNEEQYPYVLQYFSLLIMNIPFKGVFNLFSSAGNFGKTSTFLLLKQLLKAKAVQIQKKDLSKTSGMQDSLYNALSDGAYVFYVNEINDGNLDIDLIKSLTDDNKKSFTLDKKYETSRTFNNTGKFIFDTNQQIISMSRDSAFQSRVYTLEHKTLFITKNGEDYNKYCQLYNKNELLCDKKYYCEDNNFNGKDCESIMIKKPMEFTDNDGLQLFNILKNVCRNILKKEVTIQKIQIEVKITCVLKDIIEEKCDIVAYDEKKTKKDLIMQMKYIQISDLVKYVNEHNKSNDIKSKYTIEKCIEDLTCLNYKDLIISKQYQYVNGDTKKKYSNIVFNLKAKRQIIVPEE